MLLANFTHKEDNAVFRCFILLLLLFLCSPPRPSAAETVKTGAEILSENGFHTLKGTRFALVTNRSATVGGVQILEAMAKSGVQPAVIFTPEHGLEGNAEDGVKLTDSSQGDIPIKSLYGATRKPRPEDLKGLDLVLFDIQDVGVRFYTYISTMGYAMQAAAEAGIPFVVLDRPNPLGGNYVAGFVRETKPTFTALYPIPLAHGMTVGELAEMIKGEKMLPGLSRLDLAVVTMQGWQRWMRWPDTGLPWVATSPNLASFDSALLYPGIGLLEGTSASEGRGSKEPFQLAGWPGIDPQALAHKLNSQGLPGLRFDPVHFTPVSLPGISSAPKFKNRDLCGVHIEITDYRNVQPVEAGVAVMDAIYGSIQEPARKVFFRGGLDDMAGSERVRKGVEGREPVTAIVSGWSDGIHHFLHQRQAYLLYGD
ncbi:DUF1343 domain-containing protein [Geomonas sp.]|uniref:exo-beta-N-acetylmuramidase NamZ family protein n=1 Tax=Geomonas sp. TaxID=2651584 RepID=UPI002B49330A|nr:DUF1343 domain-containing protein [Geomonas sp.]HJV37000.1 DUF1343 domain-containing protein [Geomonas sp.]